LPAARVLDFLVHLQDERKLAPATLNQAVCGLRTLYRDHLGLDWDIWRKIHIKREEPLPHILTREEVALFLRTFRDGRYRAYCTVVYQCGLRLSEALAIKPRDINGARLVIYIPKTKNHKAREVPITPRLLARLRKFYACHKNPHWLFPGVGSGWNGSGTTLRQAMHRCAKPMNKSAVWAAIKVAKAECGLSIKHDHLSTHTLRHSYGTHMLEGGASVRQVAGRPLRQAHFEMIADQSLNLPLGSRIRLGKDVYQVVGLTRGMVGSGGDGLTFFTVSDAMAIQSDEPGEAIRLERAARRQRLENIDLGRLQPLLGERAAGLTRNIPALGAPRVSAILVSLQPGADEAGVRRILETWPDITVYTTQQQKDLLLSGMVDKARRQLGLFRALLIVISTIIIALIIYTLTLDKIRDIALLKLIGARNRVIGGLILQQSLLMGALGYALAWWMGTFAFPRFPRLVLISQADLVSLAFIVVAISTVASMLGIWKALCVEPNTVLAA
jgi:putative ABC transport system permease protein